MPGSDLLLTLAEIGVALAGLGSLVAVFLRRGDRANELDMPRLWLVLEFSLGLSVFSVFPLPLFHLGVADQAAFQISGLLLALFLLSHIMLMSYLRATRSDLSSGFPRALALALVSGHVLIALLLIGVWFGLDVEAVGAYLAGTSWLLVAAIVNFVRLVWVMAPR